MLLTAITDDLTGAVDSGSYFTGRGRKLRIFTSGEYVPATDVSEIYSFNLSSRNASKYYARQSHYDLMSKLPVTDNQIFMKKIGTGFRGNDPYELEGLIAARPDYCIFIIDNAPDLGTFTLYGNQYCEGEILHKSIYANDPVSPPTDSYIPKILAKNTQIPVGLINIDVVKGGNLRNATEMAINNGKKIIIFDAITDQDTLHIISDLMPIYRKVFWTGSLGIANGLAEYLYGATSVRYNPSIRDIRCICFNGSDYNVTKAQIDYSRKLGLEVIYADVDAYIDGDDSIVLKTAQTTASILRSNNVMVTVTANKYSHKPGTNIKILECIGSIAIKLCKLNLNFDRIIIIGGETSQIIYKQLNVGQLQLGLSIEPGVAEGRILDGILKDKEFAMKGGSMGKIDVLEKMMCRWGKN